MPKKPPKGAPGSAPVRTKGTKKVRGNPTKKGKIFGNWYGKSRMAK
jgi:hypothetical protein